MAKHNAVGKGSGQRRRFAGKMGVRVKIRGGYVVAMRSHSHGGGSPARSGWSCGDTAVAATPTKHMPGIYKVTMPRNRMRYVEPQR
jgi:hypothetical protein